MDEKLARILVTAGLRSSRELGELIHLLKAHCAPDEYDRLKGPLAMAVSEITNATFNPAFAAHPALQAEVDAQITKYGRFA